MDTPENKAEGAITRQEFETLVPLTHNRRSEVLSIWEHGGRTKCNLVLSRSIFHIWGSYTQIEFYHEESEGWGIYLVIGAFNTEDESQNTEESVELDLKTIEDVKNFLKYLR